VHQSDQQGAPAEAVRMHVGRAAVRRGFAGMAVRVEVRGAVVVAVLMEMHAVAPQPPQYMGTEADQHDADRALDRSRQMFGDGLAKPKRGAGKGEQCQRMANSPGQTVFDNIDDIGPARGDAGDRRDVVDLKRVLHTQQKSEPQNSKHA
jgi:hypothetical protein